MVLFPSDVDDGELKAVFAVFMRLIARDNWEDAEEFLGTKDDFLRQSEPVWRGVFNIQDFLVVPRNYSDRIGVHRDLSSRDKRMNPERLGYVSLPLFFACGNPQELSLEIALCKHERGMVAEFLGVCGDFAEPPPRTIFHN